MRRSDSRPPPADAPSRAIAEATGILARYEESSVSALAALESHDVHALAAALEMRERVARELPGVARLVEHALSAALGQGGHQADVARLLAPALQAGARVSTLDARLLGRVTHARDEIGDELARLPAAAGTVARLGARDAIVHVDVLL